VAICASTQSTAVFENMTQSERKAFIHGIETRLRDPQDSVLSNLQTASSPYYAITDNSLPNYAITIERVDDLKLLDFATIVSLGEAPARLLLPS
jgi:hypothetical protein